MDNIESIVEEKEVKLPFYSYRGVGKCFSAGISFLTDNFLFFLLVFSPVLLIGAAFYGFFFCSMMSMDGQLQLWGFIAQLVGQVMAYVMAGMVYRLLLQDSLGKGFLGYNTMTLLKASRKQLVASLVYFVIQFVTMLLLFLPVSLFFSYFMTDLRMLLIGLVVIYVYLLAVLLAVGVPMFLVQPYMMFEKGNLLLRAWHGFKAGYRYWGKSFGMILLLAITMLCVFLPLGIPLGIMLGIRRAADASIMMGDVPDLPACYDTILYVVSLLMSFVMMLLMIVGFTSAGYLYASVKCDEKEREQIVKA